MATQCVSPIKGGAARCFRMTKNDDGLCFQHPVLPAGEVKVKTPMAKEYRVVDKNGWPMNAYQPSDAAIAATIARNLNRKRSAVAKELQPFSVEVREVGPWQAVEPEKEQ